MKKKNLILLFTLISIIGLLSGCTSNDSQNAEKVPFSYAVTGTDIDGDYAYITLKNLDTETGEFTVEFSYTYFDTEKTGDDYYGGGSTPPGDSDGIEHSNEVVFVTLSPNQTESVRAPIRVPSGWELSSWDYEVIPPKKNQ